jgi:hypothetical protein
MKLFGSLALVLALFQLGVSAAAAPEEPPTCGVGEAFYRRRDTVGLTCA